MPSHDVLLLLAPPFVACLLFVAIHGAFGQHVLRRGVIFVDLALAQMSALGSTVAFAAGHDPMGVSGLAYACLFSTLGAVLLTLSRAVRSGMQAEAYIGVLYVFTTAATVVVVDRSPQGAEHVKQMLTGTILAVSGGELPKLATLYGIIALLLWAARKPLERASDAARGVASRGSLGWDFVFYAAFGVIVTSSVAIAGVLLVFCFLIIPSIIGSLFTHRAGAALLIGWVGGASASAVGLGASFAWDMPAGAALVMAFVFALLAAFVLRGIVLAPAAQLRSRFRGGARIAWTGMVTLLAVAMVWLMVMPRADQPLLELVERVGGIPAETFLTVDEQRAYAEARRSAHARQNQAARLTLFERQSRWQGERLSNEELRTIGTFQQAFNEMATGDAFVLKELTARARERQRWYVAPILLVACALALFLPRILSLRQRRELQ